MKRLSEVDFEKLYRGQTKRATIHIRTIREVVGGLPADEEGVMAFVKHYLKVTNPKEQEEATQRILHEEVGERDTTPEEGALVDSGVYSVCVVRRTPQGPWLGDWMFKAMIKQSATQVGLFASKRGSKGHVAEAGRVSACGPSGCGKPQEIYAVDEEGMPVKTYFQEFKGSPSTPMGRRSIVSHKECLPTGTNFHFTFDWVGRKLNGDDLAEIFAMARQVGLGSCKSFERGKFEVVSFEVA